MVACRSPYAGVCSTFMEDPDKDRFHIKYGSGAVGGKVVVDNIEVGGLELKHAR